MGASSSRGWDPKSAPRLEGQVVLVTGASNGLGLEASKVFARQGAKVVMLCRNEQRGAAALETIRRDVPTADAELLLCDLCSQASVRDAAKEFGKRHSKLDILCNNAGIMGTPFKLTEDGFEEQMATTHYGHFTLTGCLLPQLKAAPKARVVTHSSAMHRTSGDLPATVAELNAPTNPWINYGRCKLANLLYTLELEKRLQKHSLNITAVACHPGFALTGLMFTEGKGPGWLAAAVGNAFAQSAAAGAEPMLYAALGEDIVSGDFTGPAGNFAGPAVKVDRSARARDEAAAARLWAQSVELTKMDYLS